MECPNCGSPRLTVTKTCRDSPATILRLRRCKDCAHRLASVEVQLPIEAIHYPSGRLPARREGYQTIDIF